MSGALPFLGFIAIGTPAALYVHLMSKRNMAADNVRWLSYTASEYKKIASWTTAEDDSVYKQRLLLEIRLLEEHVAKFRRYPSISYWEQLKCEVPPVGRIIQDVEQIAERT